MKIIIMAIWMTVFSLQGWTQIKKADSLSLKERYLIKSQAQKKTGYILLGAGLGCVAIGGILAANPSSDEFIDDNTIAGGFLIVAGSLSMLASVPFFLSSDGNKKQAMKLNAGVEMEKAMPNGAYKVTYYPALSVNLSLK